MKDEDIAWLQAIELARGIRAGQYSSSEVTEAMLRYFIHKVHDRTWGVRPRGAANEPREPREA
jgi:actin-like ATPase involved in cell morphogenesis